MFYLSGVNSILKFMKLPARANKWAHGKGSNFVPEHALVTAQNLDTVPSSLSPLGHHPGVKSLCPEQVTCVLSLQIAPLGVTQKVTLAEGPQRPCDARVSFQLHPLFCSCSHAGRRARGAPVLAKMSE